jgi:hypothetical protein
MKLAPSHVCVGAGVSGSIETETEALLTQVLACHCFHYGALVLRMCLWLLSVELDMQFGVDYPSDGSFSEATEKEMAEYKDGAWAIPEEEIKQRRDLRQVCVQLRCSLPCSLCSARMFADVPVLLLFLIRFTVDAHLLDRSDHGSRSGS